MAWETTQPSLLSRVRNPQDAAAWHEFDSRYGDLVTHYARRRGLQFSDAEDIRQIVMLSLSRSLRSFEYSPQRGRFRGYLRRVVQNAISQWLARPTNSQKPLESFVVEVSATPGDSPEPIDQAWEQEWMNHHLRIAMESIRSTYEPQSLAIFERLLAGGSIETVAREFDVSTQAVHKVKQRVRNRLRDLVARQIRDEDLDDV